jgi:DNA-binding transcriptional LysR family regulator
VRIATIDAINRHFFSTMLKEVHKHYPNISFTLTTINNINIQQALISGEADFGIMLNPNLPRTAGPGVCRNEYRDRGAHRPSAGQPQRRAL